jgi:predicted lysophospholipase L1 biosynthesis ABC-type transport system permease subunit
VVGVLGVIGVLSINHALNDALAHPEWAGVTWDATVFSQDQVSVPPNLVSAVQRLQPDAVLARVDRALLPVNNVGVPTYSVRPIGDVPGEPIALALVEGRAPRVAGEADIGPATARDLGVRVGDTVTVGTAGARVRIVGEALYPQDVHQEFDEGFSLVPSQYDGIAGRADNGQALAVRFPPSVKDKSAAADAMGVKLGDVASEVDGPNVPPELSNLRNVRTMPLVLAIVLAALAVAALSYVLASSVRRRNREFAVLRTLGLSRRGARLVVLSQALVIGVIGLVLGVPLGVALGRTLWHLIADRVPMDTVSPIAVAAVVLTIPATLAVVAVLALAPAQRAARIKPAVILRAE